jgi:hypothetical protein
VTKRPKKNNDEAVARVMSLALELDRTLDSLRERSHDHFVDVAPDEVTWEHAVRLQAALTHLRRAANWAGIPGHEDA